MRLALPMTATVEARLQAVFHLGWEGTGRGKEEGEDVEKGCPSVSLSHPFTCSWAEHTSGELEELSWGPEIGLPWLPGPPGLEAGPAGAAVCSDG